MDIIFGEIGSGKTKELLRLSEEKGATIITDTQRRVNKLLDKADRYGVHINTPLVVGEDCIPTNGKYIVDNIKNVLEKIFGSTIIATSFVVGKNSENTIRQTSLGLKG